MWRCDVIVCGDVTKGSFTPTVETAFELAETMVEIGTKMGRKTQAIITDMEQPLGYAVGNSLEVKEAIETLMGKGPDDLLAVCLELAGTLLILGGKARDLDEAKEILHQKIASGEALEKLKQMVRLQGGDETFIDHPEKIKHALYFTEYVNFEEGYIAKLDARIVGQTSMLLGAGRITKESEIDLNSGIILKKKVGDKAIKGEPLACLYAETSEQLEQGSNHLVNAYKISKKKPVAKSLILGKVS